MVHWIWLALAALAAGVFGYLVHVVLERRRIRRAGDHARSLIAEAQAEAERHKKELDVQTREELARRKAAWKPLDKPIASPFLRRYASRVSSAAPGAVLE